MSTWTNRLTDDDRAVIRAAIIYARSTSALVDAAAKAINCTRWDLRDCELTEIEELIETVE